MTHDRLTMTSQTVTLLAHPLPATAEFEMRLAAWQADESLTWAELMAAWVELPTAPVSRVLVLRLIMKLIEL